MDSALTVIDKIDRMPDGSEMPMTGQKLAFAHLSIDGCNRAVEVEGISVHLTANEFKILYLLACSPGKILSAGEIYRCIWQMEDLGNAAPVRVHIARLRRKLFEACPEYRFIACKWKKGYQFLSN